MECRVIGITDLEVLSTAVLKICFYGAQINTAESYLVMLQFLQLQAQTDYIRSVQISSAASSVQNLLTATR